MSLTYFISQRNIDVGGTLGHRITFVKGVPTHVPRLMHTAVLNRGCVPCDEKGNVLEDVQEALNMEEPDQPNLMKAPPKLTAEERADRIAGCFAKLVANNDALDFAGSTPKAESVTREIGFRVDQKEVRGVWTKERSKYLGGKGAAE